MQTDTQIQRHKDTLRLVQIHTDTLTQRHRRTRTHILVQTHINMHRHTDTHRQTQIQTHRTRFRHTNTDADTQTCRNIDKHTCTRIHTKWSKVHYNLICFHMRHDILVYVMTHSYVTWQMQIRNNPVHVRDVNDVPHTCHDLLIWDMTRTKSEHTSTCPWH